MKYMLFTYRDPTVELDADQRASIPAAVDSWCTEMDDRGVRLQGHVLGSVGDTKTIRDSRRRTARERRAGGGDARADQAVSAFLNVRISRTRSKSPQKTLAHRSGFSSCDRSRTSDWARAESDTQPNPPRGGPFLRIEGSHPAPYASAVSDLTWWFAPHPAGSRGRTGTRRFPSCGTKPATRSC